MYTLVGDPGNGHEAINYCQALLWQLQFCTCMILLFLNESIYLPLVNIFSLCKVIIIEDDF